MLKRLLVNPCMHWVRSIGYCCSAGVSSSPDPTSRREHMLRLPHGANLDDPYQRFGLYGRHNRECTRQELYRVAGVRPIPVEFR